jgi:uncharacterized membrane protein
MTKSIADHHRAQSFSKYESGYLVCLTIVGATIRILYHYNRPFVGDEVGTLIYMDKDSLYLLSHFESWLTMNYFILLEKFMAYCAGYNHVSLTLMPLIAGIITIPLTYMLSCRVSSKHVAIIAATLVTFNPYLIDFSGIIRAYSILTALSIIVLILFFKWYVHRTFTNGVYVALACYFLMLSHLNGAYTVCYVLLITGVDWILSFKKRQRSHMTTLLCPLVIALLLVAISYVNIYPAISIWGLPWHDVPPTSIAYVPYVFSQYFGDGYYGWLSAVLLISALFVTYKYDMPLLKLCPYLILPVILISIQGLSHFPWAYARFIIFVVPVYIIYMSEGIHVYASSVVRLTNVVSTILVIGLIVTWIPGFQKMLSNKHEYPWNQVSKYITTEYNDNDIILYGSWSISHNLYPYFARSSYASTLLTEYSEEEHDKNKTGKVFLVTSKPLVTSNYLITQFGSLQVIVYPKEAYRKTMLRITEDLANSIKPGALSPEFTEHYRNIWELKRKVHHEDDYCKYYQLYMLCLRLTERQRNIPKSLQYYESEPIVKRLF